MMDGPFPRQQGKGGGPRPSFPGKGEACVCTSSRGSSLGSCHTPAPDHQMPWKSGCLGNRPRRPGARPLAAYLLSQAQSEPIPAAASSLGPPTPFGQLRQQVGRSVATQISAAQRQGPIVSFCAISHWPLRLWAGHRWARWLVQHSASSTRERTRCRSPAAPPPPPAPSRADPPSFLPTCRRAGGRVGKGPSGRPAAVAADTHSIRTCRRTLSITEATT